MKTLAVSIPEELDSRLEERARQLGKPKEAVVREALESFLNGGIENRPGSSLDEVRDLVGSLEGPGDLSFNKDHLRDFGK